LSKPSARGEGYCLHSTLTAPDAAVCRMRQPSLRPRSLFARLNKVIIAGNLTRSPELRYATNGNAIATFGIATNRAWTDANGERQEEVEFHNITVFGKQAETANEYLRKGQLALIEGRLRTTSWETEGVKRYRTDIIAERIQFGPKRPGDSGEPDDYPRTRAKSAPAQDASPDENMDGEPDEQLTGDNIPF
jgi:single-strand DNA-binding protein